MKIIITTASGLEAVTKRELKNLGYGEDLPAINGRISIIGEWEDVVKCNYLLRSAGHVLIELSNFKAETFDELYENVKNITWQDYVGSNGKIIVNAKSNMSKLFALSSIQSVCKKAIIEKLKEHNYGIEETGERYKIDITVVKDVVSVTLDTSGEALHKRGYRGLVGEAPLKETIASSLIQLSVWKWDRPFADVFCGSGTFPIEACYIAMNIPSGINRTFDFCEYPYFDKKIFTEVTEDAKSKIHYDREIRIVGYDIDEKQIRLARKHAQLAGVDKYVHLQRGDMRDFSSRYSHGIIMSNPPYGERLMTRREIEVLYRDYGKMYNNLDNWCCYTLTSVSDFERLFGKKADKKRKIYNGNLECNFYQMLANPPKKP